MFDAPRIERVRHELKRRRLTVARVERLPPNMVRIVLSGEELRGFTSLGFDDHVKVFFAQATDTAAGAAAGGAPEMRDFTPRRFDAAAGELWIDFFLHRGGPAAGWAAQARVGQTLEIAGPKGSAVIAPDGIDGHVLIGDETALPAIGRRLEELPAAARVLVVIESDLDAGRPAVAGRAAVDVLWVPRNGTGNPSGGSSSGGSPPGGAPPGGAPPGNAIIDALRGAAFPPGRCFVWVAAESHAARAIRGYLRNERGLAKQWIKAAGYWQRGRAGTHDSIAEEADESAAPRIAQR